MSESNASGATPTASAPRTPNKAPTAPQRNGNLPLLVGIVALVLALVATVLAVLGWFHPESESASTGNNAADAKTHLCAVTGTVRQAVGMSTNAQAPPEPAAQLAVATNARLALYGGGGFLRETVAAETKAPKDLKQAVGDYAATLQELSINYLAGAAPSDSVQQPLRDKLATEIEAINQLCQ